MRQQGKMVAVVPAPYFFDGSIHLLYRGTEIKFTSNQPIADTPPTHHHPVSYTPL